MILPRARHAGQGVRTAQRAVHKFANRIIALWLDTSLAWRCILWLGLGSFLSKELELTPYLTWVSAFVIWVVCLVTQRKRPKGVGYHVLAILLLAVGAANFSIYWSRVETSLAPLVDFGDVLQVVGRIREVVSKEQQRTLVVEVQGIRQPDGLRITKGLAQITQRALPDEELADDLRPGDQIVVTARFRSPPRAGNPGQFDYGHYLLRRGIGALAYVEGNSPIIKTEPALDGIMNRTIGSSIMTLLRWADGCRRALINTFRDHLSLRSWGILAAMVLGEKSLLVPEVQEAFSHTGQAHLLSVSGLHIGFVAAAAWYVLRLLRLGEAPSSVLTAAIAWVYALITGWNLPVVRAATTLTFYLGAGILGRGYHRREATGWAALLQLSLNPSLVFDASFQLSYGALLGIINIAPSLREAISSICGQWKRPSRLVTRGIDIMVLSLSAQLVLFPIISYYFHEFTWIGIFLSLVTIPLASLIVPFGLLGSLMGQWKSITPLLAVPLRWLLKTMDFVIERCASWPGVRIHVPAGYPGIWIGYYLVLTLMVHKLNRQAIYRRLSCPITKTLQSGKRWVCGILMGMLTVVYYPLLVQCWRPLEIVFLDVGQGDAIFVSTPQGRIVLIDGGGRPQSLTGSSFDVGKDIVLPFLRHRGVRRLDLVIASHMHNDHTQGLGAVLERMPVGMLADNGLLDGGFASRQYQRVLREVQISKGLERVVLRRGHYFDLGSGVEVMVLYPLGEPEDLVTSDILDQNNNSVVLKIQTAQHSILLTGDIDKLAQLDLVRLESLLRGREGWKADASSTDVDIKRFGLRADLLKVPHHGSREALVYSFLQAVSPTHGFISVGSNPFGHPAPEFLHALELVTGEAPWRTDEVGSIRVRIRGRRISIQGYHSKAPWVVGTWPYVRQWEARLRQWVCRVCP